MPSTYMSLPYPDSMSPDLVSHSLLSHSSTHSLTHSIISPIAHFPPVPSPPHLTSPHLPYAQLTNPKPSLSEPHNIQAYSPTWQCNAMQCNGTLGSMQSTAEDAYMQRRTMGRTDCVHACMHVCALGRRARLWTVKEGKASIDMHNVKIIRHAGRRDM